MRKIGLLLGGGGAKGAYQVGVLKAFEDAKILRHVRVVSGTSIGAINGFLLMNQLKVSSLKDIWATFNNDIIYGKNKWTETMSVNGIYHVDGILERIKPFLNETGFRNTKIDGYVTTAKSLKRGLLASLNPKYLEKEVIHLNKSPDPLAATLASAAIPLVFSQQEMDGARYVDGGLVDNFPLNPLLEAGAEIIISVGLSPKFVPTTPLLNKMWIDLTPYEELGPMIRSMLDFSQTKLAIYEKNGYAAGRMMIRYLKSTKRLGFFGRLRFQKSRLITFKEVSEQGAIKKT